MQGGGGEFPDDHEGAPPSAVASLLPASATAALAAAVHLLVSPSHVEWLPKYGCALLMLPGSSPELLLGSVHLHLVCLDEWSYQLRRSVGAPCARGRRLQSGDKP